MGNEAVGIVNMNSGMPLHAIEFYKKLKAVRDESSEGQKCVHINILFRGSTGQKGT